MAVPRMAIAQMMKRTSVISRVNWYVSECCIGSLDFLGKARRLIGPASSWNYLSFTAVGRERLHMVCKGRSGCSLLRQLHSSDGHAAQKEEVATAAVPAVW